MSLRRFANKTLASLGLKKDSLSLFERTFPNCNDASKVEWIGTRYGGNYLPREVKGAADEVYFVFGAGEDISFECELARRFPGKVFIFDPTPRAIAHFDQLSQAVRDNTPFPINNGDECYDISPADLARVSFHPYGVYDRNEVLKFYVPENPEHVSHSIYNLQGTDAYFEAECFSFSQLMGMFGQDRVTIAKMNVEGAEYKVVDGMIADRSLPDYLLIVFDEIHSPADGNSEKNILECIDKLEQNGMVPFFMFRQFAVLKNSKRP